jgi:uncharacterized Zn finger protein (UPF0148 family)
MRICQNLEVEFRRVSKLSIEASFRHTHARVPARRDAMDAAARKEKMKRDNENASAIAEKLLQGWTMLAEYCPVEGCVTPLMRSRDQKVFCVAHDMFVMSSEQADKMKHSGAGVGGETAPGRPSVYKPKEEAYVEPEPQSTDTLDDDFYKKLRTGQKISFSSLERTETPRSPAAETPRVNSAASSFANQEKATTSPPVSLSITGTSVVKTLTEKLEQARAVLHRTSVADGEEFLRVLTLVDRLAAAIKAVTGCGAV